MFEFASPDTYARLRDALHRESYTEAAVLEAAGLSDLLRVRDRSVNLLLRKAADAGRLGTLIRLWLMCVPTGADDVARATSPVSLDELIHAGLVRMEGDRVRPLVQLLPFRGFFLAVDAPTTRETRKRADYVMGIGSSSMTLANATIRRPVEAVLDIGTGCGVQAFLAASHAGRVTGVDLNARAISLATFNARLSGIDNVEFLEGNLLAPVEGRTFELIVANPPFVISPETTYIYRDGGAASDGITQRVAREAPGVLREGGFAQMICNWAHVRGEMWEDRVAGWVRGSGCDALVLRSATLSARDYAETWIDHTESDDPEEFSRRLDAWLAYFERERIESISAGLIMLRRREGSNWFAAEDAPERMKGPAGDAIAASFDARTMLHQAPGVQGLRALRVRPADALQLMHELRPQSSAWGVAAITLRLERGIAYEASLDAYLNALLLRCDGSRTLGELAAEVAAGFGVDANELVAAMEDPVRQLIARGFVEIVREQ